VDIESVAMCQPYEIFEVSRETNDQVEQMGTKEKFWVLGTNTEERWLFKFNRPETGEDWSEKISAEIAELIGLPHAIVELAKCGDRRGVLSRDFTERKIRGTLIHGNELLTMKDPAYPREEFRRVSQHSIDNIIGALTGYRVALPKSCSAPANIKTSIDLFLGYILLDALIGNTDRHHENWGILVDYEKHGIELAPTFDHASSLGRELSEKERERLLGGKDYNANIERYAQKARSAIYLNETEPKPLLIIDAFVEFAKHAPLARNVWLDKLAEIRDDSLRNCVSLVPDVCLSDKSKEFVCEFLLFNKKRLRELKE